MESRLSVPFVDCGTNQIIAQVLVALLLSRDCVDLRYHYTLTCVDECLLCVYHYVIKGPLIELFIDIQA